MKKLILALLVFIASATAALAAPEITWQMANQATLAWQPVTAIQGGQALPEGDVIKYRVYTRQADTRDVVLLPGEIVETQYTLTFDQEGSYFAGVQALRYVGALLVGESTISWTDNPAVTESGAAFGLLYYSPPLNPLGLKQLGQAE